MYVASVLLSLSYLFSGAISSAREIRPASTLQISFRTAKNLPNQQLFYNKQRNNNLFRGLLQLNKPSGRNYLAILKNGAGYSAKELRWRPPFTYEKPTHPELQKFRNKYDLDNAAGPGNEISKIKRLLAWAHKVIPYDGSRSVPVASNAMNIISTSQKNNCGFDCRGLATILNEAYLAMGFESRLLTCLPKDTSDREHHVITTVYSRTLKKWLWMDPSNNAYLMDESGTLLSVAEVRHRLIKEQAVRLNSDANLNNKPVTLEQYLHGYMTKNLYWLQTPLHSGYDTETPKANKQVHYVALFPTSFTPYGLEDIRIRNGTAYMTTNSEYFWQHPRTSAITAQRIRKRSKG